MRIYSSITSQYRPYLFPYEEFHIRPPLWCSADTNIANLLTGFTFLYSRYECTDTRDEWRVDDQFVHERNNSRGTAPSKLDK